jgi:hypothetical protein
MHEVRLLVNDIDRTSKTRVSETSPRGGTVVRPDSSARDSAVWRTHCDAVGSGALLKLVEDLCRAGHHDADCSARLDPVKALRFAPTPCGAHGLDWLSVEPTDGT